MIMVSNYSYCFCSDLFENIFLYQVFDSNCVALHHYLFIFSKYLFIVPKVPITGTFVSLYHLLFTLVRHIICCDLVAFLTT